jgi:hypothetical protein
MTDAEKEIRKTRQRAGTCYTCGENWHRARQFPRQALAAIEIKAIKRDKFNDDAAEAAMYVVQYVLRATDYALFAPEEVIFDTAASKSIFKNPSLLTDVAPSDSPNLIGGVQ